VAQLSRLKDARHEWGQSSKRRLGKQNLQHEIMSQLNLFCSVMSATTAHR